MTISLMQAILLGLFCGIAKCCIPYTTGAFMFNTVIFNAVIIGAVMGDMTQAMIIGASLQLIYLGVISAGGNQPTDPCLASYVAIPVAMVSGLNTTAAVALAVPVGLLGAQLMNLDYLLNGFFAQRGDTFAEKGDAAGMTRWSVIYCGIIRALMFAVPVATALYFGSGALQGILDDIPKFVTNGLSAMGACLPAVGFAIIANLISKPRYMPFFFAGFFLIQYTKIGTIPLLLAGLFLTFLYITFTIKDYKGEAEDEDEIMAPLVVADEQAKQKFMEEESVRNVIEIAEGADVAVFGIGALDYNSTIMNTDIIPPGEYDRLKDKGGVGEILCHVFDIEGNLIEDSFNKRLVSISFENLKKIPIRVGVAYGKEKRQAILGALRAGIVNVLITDMQAAEYLIAVEQ
ncbi:PTS sugar transporter subunit IIC [Anaerostipes caccae]|uniref:PTS sugar transporter subunit IIC n=1 Tax=Anaerostipes caccae TaxID=105841 RepID=UPI00266ECFAC|nr:PTS sugar transporter subunit IIC [Anaerostipes caccae]